MATKKLAATTGPTQLHVKLDRPDASKLVRLARGNKLSISDMIRALIRSCSV